MHRALAPDRPLTPPPFPLGRAVLAGLLAGLVVWDLAPTLAGWAGLPLTSTLFGVRAALVAAVLAVAYALLSAFEHITEGRIGADLAIAIAAGAAVLIGEPIVAAEVVLIGLIGELLEAGIARRSQHAVGQLARLFPDRCWVVRDGIECRVFTADVLPGDLVVVKPGGKIPADGLVVAGQAAVVTAALTGESLPIEKHLGEPVLAGSLVPTGTLTLRVTRTGAQTVAGQVISFTEASLRQKSQGERQADRLARYFLPVVLSLAALTFFAYFSWYRVPDVSAGAAARLAAYPMLAVLVVACPCPLVLATPAAVVAALGRLAGTGVLIKSGAALERLASVTALGVDKTGTLTTGQLTLGSVRPAPGHTASELLATARVAEYRSEHPAANAIVNAPLQPGEPPASAPDDFEAVPGLGVRATVQSDIIRAGSRRFFESENVPVPVSVAAAADELTAAGEAVVLVARGETLLGVLGVRDTVRPEAAGVLTELAELGLPATLLTGDHTAATVAHLPLAHIHAGLLPTEKAERLAPNMLYVGDGLNDAPALARATVGAAVGRGPASAAAAADLVLLGDPLRPLPLLVRLGRETARVIRQNIIGFGFGLNLIGVVLTAWLWPVLAPSAAWAERAPVAAAVFHQLGSILVLLNSMRLLRFDRPPTRLQRSVRRVNQALEPQSLDDLLHAAAHRWPAIIVGLGLLATGVWLTTGLVSIAADEAALVQRFGAARGVLEPGLHVRWPVGIETQTRFRPAAPRLIEIGFRTPAPELAPQLARLQVEQMRLRPDTTQFWEAGHLAEFDRLDEESVCLTGDGSLIELLATVTVNVTNPWRYYLECESPDDTLRAMAESALRHHVARVAARDLLTTGRSRLEQSVAEMLAATVPPELGVRVVGISVHDLHPPGEVVASFRAVAMAMQKRDETVNGARAEALRVRGRATESALSRRTTAAANATARRTEAAARAAAFHARADRLTGATTEVRQVMQTRLFLATLTAALRGRDKILIDASDLPGRRNLILSNPPLPPALAPLPPR